MCVMRVMTSHENGSGMETSTGEQRIREIIAHDAEGVRTHEILCGYLGEEPIAAKVGDSRSIVGKLRDADS